MDIDNICNENITRKIDSLGRISIPSGLRNRYQLNSGDQLRFCTLNTNLKDYILMYKENCIDPKYEITINTLTELGCEIPAILNEYKNQNLI